MPCLYVRWYRGGGVTGVFAPLRRSSHPNARAARRLPCAQIVENASGLWPERFEFHTCVYYIVVSFCTVGYGDIAPKSDLGRMLVILMLGWSFVKVGVVAHACQCDV